MATHDERVPMTVAQLRAALSTLPDDTVLKWSSWDSEYGYTYLYGVERVTAEGNIRPLLVGGYSDWESSTDDEADDEVDELAAEDVTADAESRTALYHDDSSQY